MDDFKLPPVGAQSREEDRQRWARIWFNALVRFHEVQEPEKWSFDRQDAIDFLRSKLRAGMPAWKRLKIVDGLILYGQMHPHASRQRLEPLRIKLRQLASTERLQEDEIPIEDVVGRIDSREPDVLQMLRRQLRLEGKAYNTEKAYVGKVKAFMAARALRNLADFDEVGVRDIEHHLTDLAVEKEVAPSTQNQAFFALLFLFEHVLERDVGAIQATRSTREPRIPSVMSESEVVAVLGNLAGVYQLIAQLLYGCGMRISEALRLRVKDIDFDQRLIEVHKSKGGKSRFVPLPETLVDRLRQEIHSRSLVHDQDTLRGEASVWLPHALDRKYPGAHRELKWQVCSGQAVDSSQTVASMPAPGVVEQDPSRPVGGRTFAEEPPRAEVEVGRIAPRHDAGDVDAGEVLVASTASDVRSQSFRVRRFPGDALHPDPLPHKAGGEGTMSAAGRPAPAEIAPKRDGVVAPPPADGRWRSAWETARAVCRSLVSPRAEPRVRRRGIP